MMQELSILILSCDKYSDLWDIFFDCFERFWPDCPYDIYLGSGTILYERQGVNVLYSGVDEDWSSTTRSIISQISTKYLWIFLEDTLIASTIYDSQISNIITFMRKMNAKHVHERPLPKPDRYINSEFGIYLKGAPYRVNVKGFWEKTFLLNLLVQGESPWNFEIMGSYRSSYCEEFYCLRNPVCNVLNSVEKGYLVPKVVRWCRSKGIWSINRVSRNRLSYPREILSNMKRTYFNFVVNVIPWKLRVRTMEGLRKLIISY